VLIAGYVAGLYVAAVAMLTLVVWMITGAWLLIVGVAPGSSVHDDDA